uniref:Uncharacterized protein n=1 Tax=Triticum urartu TaxID=4572 RepID=A0A8R7R9S6_TRIUA
MYVLLVLEELDARVIDDDLISVDGDDGDVQLAVIAGLEVLQQLPQRELVRHLDHGHAAAEASPVRHMREASGELGVPRAHLVLLALGDVNQHVELDVLAGVQRDVHHQRLRRLLAAAAAGPGLLRPRHRHVHVLVVPQRHGGVRAGDLVSAPLAGAAVDAGGRLGPFPQPRQLAVLLVGVAELPDVEDVADLGAHGPLVGVVEDEAGVEPLLVGEEGAAELGAPDVPHAVHVGVVGVEDGVARRRAEVPHV